MFHESERGFTLVEVLVALVVVSLLLGIVMNAALVAKTRSAKAEHKAAALTLAASLIAHRKLKPPSSNERGESGDLHWQIHESVIATDPRKIFALTEIHVAVEDESEHILTSLQTRKLKALPQ